MQIEMDYGRKGMPIEVPDDTDIFLVRETPAIQDETAAIQDALRNPINLSPLGDLVREGTKVVIVHTDITRATPNARLLPVIINELESHGVRSARTSPS